MKAAKRSETYRGNIVRILDPQGNLIRELTIDEFRKEYPRDRRQLPLSVRPDKNPRRRRRQNQDFEFDRRADEDYPSLSGPVEFDGFDDYWDVRRYDRAFREEE